MRNATTIMQRLKKSGFRLTKARKAIVKLLAQSAIPLSAPDIQKRIGQWGLIVDKTTVYRELEFLIAQTIVTVIEFGEGRTRYELAGPDHHHHVVCVRCERIEDIVLPRKFEFETRRLEVKTNFRILRHSLEFFGLCGACH